MKTMELHGSCVVRADQKDPGDVGGKAGNLLSLMARGYPVPDFFVVPCDVFDRALAVHRASIVQILQSIDGSDPDTFAAASSQVTAILESLRREQSCVGALMAEIQHHTVPGKTYAVRSSVLGEDSQDHSFAGLMQSFLCVNPEDVPDAIVRVWASAFNAGALLYRHRKGLSLTDIRAAVVVQEMVPSSVSGVLFTRDPETGEKRVVINAAFGLGEGVVANLVDTDTYTLDWEGNLVAKQVARQKTMVGRVPSSGSGTTLLAVGEDRQKTGTLGAKHRAALLSVGKSIELDFGSPQDIEWAFDESGKLWILQSRPIVRRTREDRSPRIWDNSNIVESYPGLTLPLTFSFVLDAYTCSFRRAAQGFYPFRALPGEATPIFESMIGLREGRVYYNLLNWYEMLSYLPGFEAHQRSWDKMIGIHASMKIAQKPIPWYTRWACAIIAIVRLLTIDRNARVFDKAFNRFFSTYGDLDASVLTGIEVADLYSTMRARLNSFWYRTLFNDFAAMKYYDWLSRLCKGSGSASANIHNDLLCGERGIESVQPVRSLVSIAEYAIDTPYLRELFREEHDRRIWDRIMTEDRYADLRHRLQEHVKLYGDRGIEELKLERPGLKDDPSVLVTLVRSYMDQGLRVCDQERSEQRVRIDAERKVFRSMRNPFINILLRVVLRNARHAIAYRENMRFARTRTFGLMRQMFRRLGDLFVSSALLEVRDDIFYLTVAEALSVVRGTATTGDLRQLVRTRTREYEEFVRRSPEERFITTGIPGLCRSHDRETVHPTGSQLQGTPCSSGRVSGEGMVVLDPATANGKTGKILIARSTDPGWVFLMIVSKGIIVEKGSVLSHTAIIGRELGIPTVVGVKEATTVIPNGSQVELDAEQGVITWH